MGRKKENLIIKSKGGISFSGLLTVLFVGLKLTNYITWSWLWVLSPLWLPLVSVIGILWIVAMIGLTFAGILGIIGWFKKKSK